MLNRFGAITVIGLSISMALASGCTLEADEEEFAMELSDTRESTWMTRSGSGLGGFNTPSTFSAKDKSGTRCSFTETSYSYDVEACTKSGSGSSCVKTCPETKTERKCIGLTDTSGACTEALACTSETTNTGNSVSVPCTDW